MATMPTARRVVLLCVALFVVLFAGAGCIFGWLSATALMTGDAASAEQRQSFAIALQVAGVVMSVATAILGPCVDTCGPRLVATLSAAVLIGGHVLLAASLPASDTDVHALPSAGVLTTGLSLIAFGGIGPYLASFNFCSLFPSRPQHVVAAITGIFTLSGINWQCFRWAGISSARRVFATNAWVAGACLVLCALCYPARAYTSADGPGDALLFGLLCDRRRGNDGNAAGDEQGEAGENESEETSGDDTTYGAIERERGNKIPKAKVKKPKALGRKRHTKGYHRSVGDNLWRLGQDQRTAALMSPVPERREGNNTPVGDALLHGRGRIRHARYSSAPSVSTYPTVDLARFSSLAVPLFVHPTYWKIRRETRESDVFDDIHDHHDFGDGDEGSDEPGSDVGDVEEGGGDGEGEDRPPSPVRFGPSTGGGGRDRADSGGGGGGGYRVPSPHRGSPSRQSHHSTTLKPIRSITPCMLVEAIADRPFKKQLRSPQFVGITLFFSINLTWQLFFFSTVLSEVPWDREETKVFTSVVTLVANGVPPLLTPAAGALMGRFGFGVSCALTNLFAVLMFLTLVAGKLAGSLPVCIVAVVFFSLQRTLTFSIFFSYVALVFGGKNYGKLVGLATVVAAVVGCCNYGFTFWAGADCQHCTAVNILLAAVVVPLFYHSWKLWGWEKEA